MAEDGVEPFEQGFEYLLCGGGLVVSTGAPCLPYGLHGSQTQALPERAAVEGEVWWWSLAGVVGPGLVDPVPGLLGVLALDECVFHRF